MELKFTTSYQQTNGLVMVMAWAHGIRLVTDFVAKVCTIMKGNDTITSYPLEEITIERMIGLQELCQNSDNELAKFQ